MFHAISPSTIIPIAEITAKLSTTSAADRCPLTPRMPFISGCSISMLPPSSRFAIANSIAAVTQHSSRHATSAGASNGSNTRRSRKPSVAPSVCAASINGATSSCRIAATSVLCSNGNSNGVATTT